MPNISISEPEVPNINIAEPEVPNINIAGIDAQGRITGPWLWMIVPTRPFQGGAESTNIDSLAAVSNDNVTEVGVAESGANEGDRVGRYTWTLAEIRNTNLGNTENFANEIDNVTEVVNRIGWAKGDVNHHSAYALITLESATAENNVRMHVGSDDSIKVWLNGTVVHNNPVNRGSGGFQDTFRVNLKQGDNLLLVKVSEAIGNWSMFVGIDAEVNAVYKPAISTETHEQLLTGDINGDGIVNIQDLVLVASYFGKSGKSDADVNKDGVVNITDLVLVAGALGNAAAAPVLDASSMESVTVPEVKQWLTEAKLSGENSLAYRRGILMLEQLLMVLIPKETDLLPNYPNPFNPETWIPYQLAEPADVVLTIYAMNGQLIRTLALGHQPAGIYHTRSRAAYWDGRNHLGESVASGIYFYTLSAGDFTATRKLLIRK